MRTDTLCDVVKIGRKQVIGIIGGMCSGKSTVAAELAKLGCAVIDADHIAHQFLNDKDVRAKIVRLFGREVLDEEGKISRAELASRVFKAKVKSNPSLRHAGTGKVKVENKGDADRLGELTGILHPLVLARVEQLIAKYTQEPWFDSAHHRGVKAIVLDMPLLVEVGWKKRCDRIIFVDCNLAVRLKRAQKMGFFDAEQLKVRENLQISLDKKRRIADNIVDNNSDLSGLSKQIACLFSSIVDNR
ncbi:MAG: dephospho-CoA kinase [Sedimentisphaerales bacterium]|nr:dephospho-CoA kinase [Sedimentisphaerales bacterium]